MNTAEKILNVLAKNLGYTVVLGIAIVLFAIFSDGLISGVITALSAVIGYTCVVMLYKEFAKTPVATPARAAKKPAARKKAK